MEISPGKLNSKMAWEMVRVSFCTLPVILQEFTNNKAPHAEIGLSEIKWLAFLIKTTMHYIIVVSFVVPVTFLSYGARYKLSILVSSCSKVFELCNNCALYGFSFLFM